MFGLGFSHLILLGLIALIFIKPEDLPKVARSLGRFINELRRGSESLRNEFTRTTIDLEKEIRIDPIQIDHHKTTPETETPAPHPEEKKPEGES